MMRAHICIFAPLSELDIYGSRWLFASWARQIAPYLPRFSVGSVLSAAGSFLFAHTTFI